MGELKDDKERVTLYNVIDTRTNKFHTVAVVLAKYVKYFIPADPDSKEPIMANE